LRIFYVYRILSESFFKLIAILLIIDILLFMMNFHKE